MLLVRAASARYAARRRAACILALAGPCLALACDSASRSASARSLTRADSAEQVMYGVRTALTAGGLRRGELTADTALSYSAATRYELHGVRGTFATSLGRPLSSLSARQATIRVGDSTSVIRGTVVIASDTSGRRLETPLVTYHAGRNELSSDSTFVATAGTRRLTGTGFVSDPGLFTLRCLRECTGTLSR